MKSFEKETIRKQLKDESQCLKDLEKAYQKAKKDCQEQLRRLNSRKDMQNLQSIIYQKKYQTALLKQIDGVLNDLQTHTYKTANEFFQGSYQNGYIGSMYELQKQGIPFTIPVDPKKMVTAIQTDSKISKEYYLGKGLSVQNIRTLKKQIALEATRGIASGQGWLEVAESLAVQKCFQISLSDSMRICRTEGNRINQQARLDAGDEAVQNGCDILKQWDATLDGVTRPAHREADGQIREWGEDFIVMGEKLPAPSVGGSASNVCNCRCQLLKRPRWALDDEELEVLKQRASYYGLDKTKNFEEYKEKFLKLPPVPVQVEVVQAVQNKVSPDSIRSDIKKIQTDITELERQEANTKSLINTVNSYNKTHSEDRYDSTLIKLNEILKDLETQRKDLAKQLNEKGRLLIRNINDTFEVKDLDDDFVSLILSLDKDIKYKEVQKHDVDVSDIISLISGGDKTSGSCASVGLSYIGQKNGLNVLDFRNGSSLDWFSDKTNKVRLFKILDANSSTFNKYRSSLANGKQAIASMQEGKEYYLSVGRHASIVRLFNGKPQYLELQSAKRSGWIDFDSNIGNTLQWRFACTSKSCYYPYAHLTDIDSLKDSDKFRTVLGYINTAENEQVKGRGGTIK